MLVDNFLDHVQAFHLKASSYSNYPIVVCNANKIDTSILLWKSTKIMQVLFEALHGVDK